MANLLADSSIIEFATGGADLTKIGADVAEILALMRGVQTASDPNLPGPVRGTGTKHIVLAASGSFTWTPDGKRIIRKIISDTAQWALTTNGMTYAQILALAAGSQISQGILIYSNAAIQDGLSIFIPYPTNLTLSCSASGTQRITVQWDYV